MSLEQRLHCHDILERIERIESAIANGHDAFVQSHVLQDAIIHNFIVIGEATKKLDATLTEQQPHVQWRSIAGFRDFLIHQYRRTRLELVWQAAKDDLPALKSAVTSMLASLDEPPPASDQNA